VASYGKELTKAKDEILSLVAGARVQTHDLARSNDPLFADELRKIFNRIKFISAFFGIQNLTDITHWAVRYLDFLMEQQHFSDFPPELFQKILDRSSYLMENLDLPKSYGEFIKPTGVTVRPLFKKHIETMDLQSELAKKYPLSMAKKSIYRLPVVLGKGYPYSLRVPSRFINKRDREDTYLSLIYSDLFRLKDGWEEWLAFFNESTEKGMILFQGSLELPIEKFQRQSDILPYYFLLQTLEPPRRFLKGKSMAARVIKVLQGPGSELLVDGDWEEGGEWETPIDIDGPSVNAPGMEKELEPLENSSQSSEPALTPSTETAAQAMPDEKVQDLEEADEIIGNNEGSSRESAEVLAKEAHSNSRPVTQGFREENMIKAANNTDSTPSTDSGSVATLEAPQDEANEPISSQTISMEKKGESTLKSPMTTQGQHSSSVEDRGPGQSVPEEDITSSEPPDTLEILDNPVDDFSPGNKNQDGLPEPASSGMDRHLTTQAKVEEVSQEYEITSEAERPQAAEIPFTVQDLAQNKNLPRRAPSDEELLEIIRRKDLVSAIFQEPESLEGLDIEELPEGEEELEDLSALDALDTKTDNPANTLTLSETGDPQFEGAPEAADVQDAAHIAAAKKRLWPGTVLILIVNLFFLIGITYAFWQLPFQVIPSRLMDQAREIQRVVQEYATNGGALDDADQIKSTVDSWEGVEVPWQLVSDTASICYVFQFSGQLHTYFDQREAMDSTMGFRWFLGLEPSDNSATEWNHRGKSKTSKCKTGTFFASIHVFSTDLWK
jgi:hypothetical protein